MRVASDNPEVVRLVTLIADEVVGAGGYVHPELVVNHEGGSLWLSLPREHNPHLTPRLDRPHPEAPPMLVVPGRLHIPVTNLAWVASDTELAYTADTAHLTSGQQAILDAMVSLFNTIDKVRIVGRSYARHSIGEDPELSALVAEARPGWLESQQPAAAVGGAVAAEQGEQAEQGEPESPAHSVMRSRLRSEMGEGDEGPLGYFMPMIDMLNHHPYGSRYEHTDDGDWLIRVHHPTPTDQVFVRYNKADSFGVALGLGYFEADTRFVSSVACRVGIPDVVEVKVAGVGAARRRLPAPRVSRSDDGLVVRGLVLELPRRDALTQLLAMPLRSLHPDRPAAVVESWAQQLIAGVVAANRDFFTRLEVLCAQDADEFGLRPIFGRVARRQLELLAEWD
ncbi:MAG: hypothetical protein E6Q90_02675 [Actinobacteria bacterium]|nr:MAG: hypothetical protein E6Q90_02675 [Actinomycetota bacterium]